jgi:hypothetical protein
MALALCTPFKTSKQCGAFQTQHIGTSDNIILFFSSILDKRGNIFERKKLSHFVIIRAKHDGMTPSI